MAQHSGVISLGGDPIDVVLVINSDRIQLHSNGSRIGDWSGDECQVVATTNGEYSIRAEGEELPFLPSDPTGLADDLENETGNLSLAHVVPEGETTEQGVELEPGKLTMVGFYLLAGATALLGLWAAWSLIV